MQRSAISLGLLILGLSCAMPAASPAGDPAGSVGASADTVSVGYDMAEAGVNWLDLVAQGADEESLRAFFFDEVAPTAGCQAIIAHWARFGDWDRHAGMTSELYAMAAADIGHGLDGKLTTNQLVEHWLGGMQGPAYAVGMDMMRIIDSELGRATVIGLARDSRPLLEIYNRAARSAREHGEKAYLFPDSLAARLAGN